MPRGPQPILLILTLAMPAAAGALGLGDIHVDSALNEPLSAQIEIVGASLDDLTDLRAVVANMETFQRYGAERPTFLNSATFTVGRDYQGRPVLNVRSRDSFTDPLVSFLVDLKWRNSEFVREYSLLLDPAERVARRSVAASAASVASPAIVAPAASVTPPAIVAPPAGVAPPAIVTGRSTIISSTAGIIAPKHAWDSVSLHRITSRDTLRAIVRHAGARTETQVERMMIATFRANPGAFEGNINRLHRGVVLQFPASIDVDAISSDDAKRDVDEQMLAWRTRGRYGVARHAAVAAVAGASMNAPKPWTESPAPAATTPAPPARDADREQSEAALTSRLQSLEKQLGDLHRQMVREYASMQELKEAATHAALAPAPATHGITAGNYSNLFLGLAALLLGAFLAGYAYIRKRLQRPALRVDAPGDKTENAVTSEAVSVSSEAAGKYPSEASAAAEPSPAIASPVATNVAPVTTAKWPPRAGEETNRGMAIEVDTEALERSYLESLGFNTSAMGKHAAAAIETADETAEAGEVTVESTANTVESPVTTAELEMSEVEETEIDESEVNTAVIKVDATTLVVPIAAEVATPAAVDPAASATTELDYNLTDLDATAQHVQMPSALNDRVEVSESRTNIVDVLKMAIDRDPHRRDLRMKLVETYYNAASGNQRAFMEVVRKLAREREYMSAEEWNKIVRMGRELAPDDILFTDLVKDENDVAA